MTQQLPQDKRPRLNPRVIAMLILFALVISATVIAADILSPRDRHPMPATTAPSAVP